MMKIRVESAPDGSSFTRTWAPEVCRSRNVERQRISWKTYWLSLLFRPLALYFAVLADTLGLQAITCGLTSRAESGNKKIDDFFWTWPNQSNVSHSYALYVQQPSTRTSQWAFISLNFFFDQLDNITLGFSQHGGLFSANILRVIGPKVWVSTI